jgi:hypothetical protein
MITKVHNLKINNPNLDMDNQNPKIHNQVIKTCILPLSTKMLRPRIKNPNLYMVHQTLINHAPLETKLKIWVHQNQSVVVKWNLTKGKCKFPN